MTCGPIDIAVAVIIHRGRVLVARRDPDAHLGGLLEFPGGKVDPGESVRDAVMREVNEETGLDVETRDLIDCRVHHYPTRSVRLHFYLCRLQPSSQGRPLIGQGTWLDPDQLDDRRFPEGNREVLAWIRSRAHAISPPDRLE